MDSNSNFHEDRNMSASSLAATEVAVNNIIIDAQLLKNAKTQDKPFPLEKEFYRQGTIFLTDSIDQ